VLRMTGKQWTAPVGAILFFFLILVAAATPQQQTDQKQNIPDAPSASRPPQPFPAPPPAEPQGLPPSEAPTADQVPGNEIPPTTANPAPPNTESNPNSPPHPLDVKTVPEGGATPDNTGSNAQDELFKITRNVNQVIVPVRVTDDSGRLVSGLLPKDFSVYEDGKKRTMNFFTSDPLAISAAVVFDLGMSDINVQKVNQTFPALEGAFSQFDEVAIYTYSGTVGRMAAF
jgi:hypothetical protein